MFARKLTALGYHHPDSFNLINEQQVRNLVVWLEDQKIRFYKIENREPLRDTESPFWVSALKKYLSDIKCPVENLSNKQAVVNWLISHAVQLEYAGNSEKYNSGVEEKKKSTLEKDSWLHSVNRDDPELKKGIALLQKIFHIPSHPDHLLVLQAIAKLIQDRLSEKSTQTPVQKKSSEFINLESISLGLDTKDDAINEAAKILRLLQIGHLRELQTRINQSIVAMQKLSANPKTDQSLGKVGR